MSREKIMYGYEGWDSDERRWSDSIVGHQGRDNLFSSLEEAETGLDDLAAALEWPAGRLRLAAFAVDDGGKITRTMETWGGADNPDEVV